MFTLRVIFANVANLPYLFRELHLDPVYTIPDSLVATSSFAAQEQRLTTKVYSFDNVRCFCLLLPL